MIGIDGEEPFSERWAGSDVSRLVDDDQPFLPGVVARRVAIGYCPCGGGVSASALAPLIRLSPDEQTISWVDFRSFNLGSWGSVPRKLAAGRGFLYEAPDLHLVFECTRVRCEQRHHRRQLLYLESLHDDPAAAAADIIARLLATPTDQWVQTFPGH